MRMLWISFMLLGSITCAPPKPDRERSTWWTVVSPSQQEPSKPVYQNPSGQVGGSVGHSSYPGIHYSSSTGGASSGPTYGVQHAGHQHSQHAAPGDSSSQFAEESWSSSSDTSGADEPVFSPVDEEDQVYAYKSKSRYNRKRLRFSQFRYTPTEPIVLQPPVFPNHGKISHYPGKKGH
ncbi:hypothetical protein ATANTOWER_018946 [Ataeniobius toweri]|uniref:Uncharacterized protein n=1 Tax=Ataeniobius toweri TaxID=208326 RepID=A0ABU7BAE2_9TELE|nr:hypothetical protein [Ataeniobius toweri]